MKRKYGDRADWQRIIKRRYAQKYIDTEEFHGHITLIDMIEVKEPLSISPGEKEICVVDDGYMWLQQFLVGKNYSVTTTFDREGSIVQGYIDICLEYGMENGVPYLDDLYLDIVVLPSGEIILMDEDELEEAFSREEINQEQYDLAWTEARKLIQLIEKKEFRLLDLADTHKEMLEKLMRNMQVE